MFPKPLKLVARRASHLRNASAASISSLNSEEEDVTVNGGYETGINGADPTAVRGWKRRKESLSSNLGGAPDNATESGLLTVDLSHRRMASLPIEVIEVLRGDVERYFVAGRLLA